MFDKLGIRGKLLIHGLLTVSVALVLVIAVVWAALWALGWRQAKERLTQATQVVSRSLAGRISQAEESAMRIVADKELTGKTGFVLEESGKSDIREMVVVERRNLTLALGRALAAVRGGEAAIYGMEGQIVCAAQETTAGDLSLWCPDDRKTGQFLHTVVAPGQTPQPGDWREADPPTTPAAHLAGGPRSKAVSGCVVRDDGFWIATTVPVIGLKLNPETFAAEPIQQGQLTLRNALDAAFVREQCELTSTRINVYVGDRLIGGTVNGYVAPTVMASGRGLRDGLAAEDLAFATVHVADGAFFAALAPVLADGVRVGSAAIMLPQTETRRSLMWVTGLTIAAGIVAALVATVVGVWLSRAIARPIQVLLRRATDIADHHNLDQVIDVTGEDEIGRLAAAFNQMLGSLKAYYLDLQSTNAKLQDEIAQRRRAEGTYRTLYESTSDAVMLLRPEGFIDCNAAALRLFGSTDREWFLRLHPADLSPATQADGRDSRALADAYLAEALGQGTARFEWVHRRADGTPFEADVWLTAVELDSQRIVQAVIRDITKAKRAQEELERLVERRTADLQAANRHLQREIGERRRAEDLAAAANQAKSLFLANMSHEIRTPMTAILGFTELLTARDLSDADRLSHMETIRRNGQHLLAIINDILDLSKIEAGRMAVEKTTCSITQVLQEVASLMQPRAIGKNIAFGLEFASSVPDRILSDPVRIRQILLNLVGNAIKFTEEGSVRVVTRLLDGPLLQFEVLDTGIGISAEQMERIFQPFAQAENSTSRRFGGTGLGLTISRRLAEMLGGTIRVRSTPGQGSTFTVTIATGPLEKVAMIGDPREALSLVQEAAASPRPGHPLDCTILLAEDGPDNQRLFAHMLTAAGARVTVVENGSLAVQAALSAAEAGYRYDVILMDMQMPVLDGYAATKMLRGQGYRGAIIALTAHAMASDRDKCIAAGCDDYAAKPINRRALQETIREQLAKRQVPPAAVPQASDMLVSELAGDADLADLVLAFVGELPGRVEALRRQVAAQDLAEVSRLAHQLKGSAGGYGFPRITEAAANLERSAGARESLEQVTEALAQMADLCMRARAGSHSGSESGGDLRGHTGP